MNVLLVSHFYLRLTLIIKFLLCYINIFLLSFVSHVQNDFLISLLLGSKITYAAFLISFFRVWLCMYVCKIFLISSHNFLPSWVSRIPYLWCAKYSRFGFYSIVWSQNVLATGYTPRGAVAQVDEAVCYKPKGCVFDSRYGLWDFSLT